MKGQRFLRHLDEVVVPRLARGFARMSGKGRSPRWRLHLLTALGLAATTATLVTVAFATHSGEPGRRQSNPGATVHVGVSQGQSIPGYVSRSHDELVRLVNQGTGTPAEVYALVSLKAYLAPERLTPVVGGVSVAEVYARVPLAQAQTQIVRIPAYRIPDDVVTGMRQVAARKEADVDDFRRLAGKLSQLNPAEDQLRTTYLDEATVAAQEANAYRNGCTCVYAVVVRATPAALEQIGARPEVRAVDPAPEVLRLDQAVFLAPLPEQSDTVRPSPTTVASPTPSPSLPAPTPSPSPSVAPSVSPSGGPPSPSPSRSIEPLR